MLYHIVNNPSQIKYPCLVVAYRNCGRYEAQYVEYVDFCQIKLHQIKWNNDLHIFNGHIAISEHRIQSRMVERIIERVIILWPCLGEKMYGYFYTPSKMHSSCHAKYYVCEYMIFVYVIEGVHLFLCT